MRTCARIPVNDYLIVTGACIISVKSENASLMAADYCQVPGASPWSRCYFPGIYHEPKCSSSVVTHAMLVVGYGFEGREADGRNYWLVKNRYRLLKLFVFRVGRRFFCF